MQNSYQQMPYNGKQSYMAVPQPPPAGAELPQYSGVDVEKAAPANFNPSPNFRPSPNKDSIYLPLIKRRVAKKTFWIVVGVVAGVIVVAIIVGVAVGVSKSKNNNKGGKGRGAQGAKGGRNGSGGGGFDSGDGDDTGTGDDGSGTPDGGSSSTDPCQQLVEIGAPWSAISDCLHQQHVTTMELIDNFDGSNDYNPYTDYNPYSSSGSTDKPDGKPHNRKVDLVVGIDRAGKLLHGRPSAFHGNLDAHKDEIRQGFHHTPAKPAVAAVSKVLKSLGHSVKGQKQPLREDKDGKPKDKGKGDLDGKKAPKPTPTKAPGNLDDKKTHGKPTKLPGKTNEKTQGNPGIKAPRPTKVPQKTNEKSPGNSDVRKAPKPTKIPQKTNEKSPGNSDLRKAPRPV
ncbi:hypothetical protein TWF730_005683 [Orbilia blumenaviensis]|uniref:Uncharacterized protein n=1 Tax=Orbilia blumenaviensis TaxID=1796055 RepID=A0AAV9VL83_9PEZI